MIWLLLTFLLIFSPKDSPCFQNRPTSQQDSLLADLSVAESSCAKANESSTNKKYNITWSHWQTFCQSSGLEDNYFFEQINDPTNQKHIILAFAKVLQTRQYSKGMVGHLHSGSVRDFIGAISPTTIRSTGHLTWSTTRCRWKIISPFIPSILGLCHKNEIQTTCLLL